MNDIKLTAYSHGAGCGCKIAPNVLDRMLHGQTASSMHPGLLVGNADRDDAAVLDLGDGTAVISTTDFFMPIVDDPQDFGRIAAVNAISDVYAMGGTPLLAIGILGWPIAKLPIEIAGEVLAGARTACDEAGIALAGGHSIDSPEPIFGLVVTGRVNIAHLKRNGGATPGASLFLTKPLGVGILSTAQKRGALRPEHASLARDAMVQLNRAGEAFGRLACVQAMTDVTGFGLLGHLREMCAASNVSATIEATRVPLLDRAALQHYLELGCVPGGTQRNLESYGHLVGTANGEPLAQSWRNLLCDPQTSGGLLVAVAPGAESSFLTCAAEHGLHLHAIGRCEPGPLRMRIAT